MPPKDHRIDHATAFHIHSDHVIYLVVTVQAQMFENVEPWDKYILALFVQRGCP